MLAIATGLALIPAVASGFSRFAYALVLPAMRSALGWSYTTAGAVNTASAIGFLLGSLGAAAVTIRWGERRVLVTSLVLTAAIVLASGVTGAIAVVVLMRLLAGVTAAVAFVVGSVLAARLARAAPPRTGAVVLGIYFGGGGGLGVVIPGLVVPAAIQGTNWQTAWLALGLMSVVGAAVAVWSARLVPGPVSDAPDSRAGLLRWPIRTLWPLLWGYGLFGAGYIPYMTFIVAHLEEEGANDLQVSAFWAVLGLAAVAGSWLWSPVLGRNEGGQAPVWTLVAVLVGSVLPLISGSLLLSFVSATIFGGSFLATPSAVTNYARNALPQHWWSSTMAALTATFALGQCLGPLLAGAFSNGRNGVGTGLLIGAGLLVASIALTLRQPRRGDAS
ncbi:YbfB/YjiJ family MFS transporter [Georgenia alba]|uniref:YbfB/YjiJ family MFS transporter n=1 Tax=Georgenia alba TaxID=2233858 RepID=A0ABW2Q5Q7_9MICO